MSGAGEVHLRLAVFGLVFFGILAVYAYLRVQQIERPSDALIARLSPGKHGFDVFDANRCAGGMEVEFREDPGLVLIVRGTVRAQLLGHLFPMRIFVGAFFNSLNQLVSANIQLETGGQGILIALSQPNPVHVRISLSKNEQNQAIREFDVPGPIELIRNPDRTYRLSYVRLKGNFQRMVQQFSFIGALPQPTGATKLRVVDGTGNSLCGRDEQTAGREGVVLDGYFRQLSPLIDSSLGNLLASKMIGKQ